MNEQRMSGRHQLNIGHLVMGLAFLGIVGIWGLVQTDTVTGDDIRWLLPIPWVVAGAVGLAATAVTGSRRYAVRQTGWAGQEGWVGQPEPATEQTPEPVVEEPLVEKPVADRARTEIEETAPLTFEPEPQPESQPDSQTDPQTETQTETHPEEKP
jgi:hypothetical protein